MKNQLNTSLTSKLQKVKDHLKAQKKVLEESKREIERLKGWGEVANTRAASRDMPPASTPSKRSSKKRHSSQFQAKHRQLMEEERQAFRHQSKGAWSETPSLLIVPPEDKKWYEDSEWNLPHKEGRRVKRVRFEAEAIVLNAALEGELELLKECTRKVMIITSA